MRKLHEKMSLSPYTDHTPNKPRRAHASRPSRHVSDTRRAEAEPPPQAEPPTRMQREAREAKGHARVPLP